MKSKCLDVQLSGGRNFGFSSRLSHESLSSSSGLKSSMAGALRSTLGVDDLLPHPPPLPRPRPRPLPLPRPRPLPRPGRLGVFVPDCESPSSPSKILKSKQKHSISDVIISCVLIATMSLTRRPRHRTSHERPLSGLARHTSNRTRDWDRFACTQTCRILKHERET